MKIFYTFFTTLILLFTSDGLVLPNSCKVKQPINETKEEVEAVVKEMFHLFHIKDVDALNKKFIHPKYGFFHMYRPGVMDIAEHHMQLDKKKSKAWTKENTLFRVSKIERALRWESVDTYCENLMWTKGGIFIHKKPYLSVLSILKFGEDFANMKPSKIEKERATFLTKNLLVIVDTKENIVFYIKKIDGEWYLTHIDRATSDCSV